MRLKLFTLDDFKKCYRVLRIIGKKAIDPSEELVPDDSFLSTKKVWRAVVGKILSDNQKWVPGRIIQEPPGPSKRQRDSRKNNNKRGRKSRVNKDDDEDDDDDEEEEIKVATEHAKSLFDQKIRASPTRNIFLAVQPLTCEKMFPSKILGVLEDMLEKVFQGIEAFGLLVKVNIVFQRRNEIGEPTDEDPTPAVLYPFVLMRPDLIFASRTREMIVSEIAPRPDPQSPQLYARQPPRQDSETRLLPRGQLTEPQRFIRLVLHVRERTETLRLFSP